MRNCTARSGRLALSSEQSYLQEQMRTETRQVLKTECNYRQFEVNLESPEKTGNLPRFKSMMQKHEKSRRDAWRSNHVHISHRSRVFI